MAKKKSRAADQQRIRRYWARRAPLIVVVVGIASIGAGRVLLEDGPPRAVPVWEPGQKTPTQVPSRRPVELLQPQAGKAASAKRAPEVASVVSSAPQDRVRALRELERTNPPAAVVAATRLVRDPERLVRLNAVAVLARSSSPQAAETLAALDPTSQQLAMAVRERK